MKKFFSLFAAVLVAGSMMATEVGFYTLLLDGAKAYKWYDDDQKTEITDLSTFADGALSYADGVWTMNGLKFSTGSYEAVCCKPVGSNPFILNIVGGCELSSSSTDSALMTCGLVFEADSAVIQGSGTLYCHAGRNENEDSLGCSSFGIEAYGSLTIAGPKVVAEADDVESEKVDASDLTNPMKWPRSIGLFAQKNLTIKSYTRAEGSYALLLSVGAMSLTGKIDVIGDSLTVGILGISDEVATEAPYSTYAKSGAFYSQLAPTGVACRDIDGHVLNQTQISTLNGYSWLEYRSTTTLATGASLHSTKATPVDELKVESNSLRKLLENGRVIVLRNGVRYDLNGHIVK